MKKILIILLLFTGCNYKELNNIAIVTGIYIDYNKQYELDIMVSKDKNIIYHTSGKTIDESLSNLTIPKQLYLGHLDILIINENAYKRMNNITNYFNKNKEVSKRFYIMMSKKNIIKKLSKLEPFPFNKISLIKLSDNNLTYDKYINLLPTDTIIFSEPKYDSSEKILVKLENELAKYGCNIVEIPKQYSILQHLLLFPEYSSRVFQQSLSRLN